MARPDDSKKEALAVLARALGKHQVRILAASDSFDSSSSSSSSTTTPTPTTDILRKPNPFITSAVISPVRSSKSLEFSSLREFQSYNERECISNAAEQYLEALKKAEMRSSMSSLPATQNHFSDWFPRLYHAIKSEQAAVLKGEKGFDRSNYGPALMLLKAEKLAVITMHEAVDTTMHSPHGAKFVRVCDRIGEAIRADVNMKFIGEKDGKTTWGKEIIGTLKKASKGRMRQVNKRAEQLLVASGSPDSDDQNSEWPMELKIKVGAALISLLIRECKTSSGGPAFVYEKRRTRKNKVTGFLRCSEETLERVTAASPANIFSFVRHQPMVVKPVEWSDHNYGGYLELSSSVMRTHGCMVQRNMLKETSSTGDLDVVYKGLNSLQRIGWQIDGRGLDVCQEAWELGLPIADLPRREDMVVPSKPKKEFVKPKRPDGSDYDRKDPIMLEYYDQLNKYYNAVHHVERKKQRNAEMHSLRCDTMIKLMTAEKFRDYEIFFPYNLDFRGRVYPIPPNLNHVGSDLCRGMLRFSESKPLTERGWEWLRIHIANLFGVSKVSYADRLQWVEDNFDKLRDSAENPIHGHRFWLEADEPWQALAACRELMDAFDSGDPVSFESSLPVHQDGSCNGLQHYAALGRDLDGGTAVNLCPTELPQDVYMGVCKIVIGKVNTLADSKLPIDANPKEKKAHASAVLLKGKVGRKTVKQTVMTSVYGVTAIGARMQVERRLIDIFKDEGVDTDEIEKDIYDASFFLSRLTMEAMNELFTGAREIMSWLQDCSEICCRQGQPMSWITPLGLPCIQPYRKENQVRVSTLMQRITIARNTFELPVDSRKVRQDCQRLQNIMSKEKERNRILIVFVFGVPFTLANPAMSVYLAFSCSKKRLFPPTMFTH